MTADPTAILRAELTRRLQGKLPPAAIAPVADAAVDAAASFFAPNDDAPAVARAALDAALAACAPQYRPMLIGLSLVEQAVSAWLAARVVEVEAGSVTVTDHRGD